MGYIGDIVIIRKEKPLKFVSNTIVYADSMYTGMYGIIIYKKVARRGAFYDVLLSNGQHKIFHRLDIEVIK